MTTRRSKRQRLGRALIGLPLVLASAAGWGCSSAGNAAQQDPPITDPDAGDATADAVPEASSDVTDAAQEPEAASPCLPDEDQDGIPDKVEGKDKGLDTDGDGTPDYLDDDSDGDGIPDLVEGDTANAGCMTPQDSDGDGTPDFQDLDSDDNGLPDGQEVHPDGSPYEPSTGVSDTDHDGYPDYADPDNDGDGLPDTVELGSGVAVDTDGDGIPDLDDTDSDDDGILDKYEGASDVDGDGKANFRDLDSDDDGVPDACEAGPGHTPQAIPADTDSDGKYDFLDRDSDGDGLRDELEDVNGDCMYIGPDGLPEPGETDRLYPDSDSDGVSDLIEVTLGSDPNDPWSTPQSEGKFYFELPYEEQAKPPSQLVPVAIGLQRADVGFVIDTTGTMGEEIAALKNGLTSIVPKFQLEVPDVAIGVAAHDDYPVDTYGVAPQDLPFYLPSPDGIVSTDPAAAVSALTAITLHNGNDDPESQVPAMYRALTNQPIQWPANILQSASIPFGRMGAIAFRKDALPILVSVTDAAFHNGHRASDPSTLHDPYSFNNQSPYPVPTADTLVTSMKAVGARFIGIASDDGVRAGDPYDDMAWLADATGSVAPPSAFGGTTCNTALGGLSLTSPDGPNGTCRLVFDVRKNGIGVTDRLVDAVKALVRSLVMDVRVIAIPDAPTQENGWVDSVDLFVESVEVSDSGGDDPTDPAFPCAIISPSVLLDAWIGPKGEIPGGDTHWDTMLGANAGMKICYSLTVNPNTTIPPAADIQVFHAVLQVKAKNGNSPVELDFGPPRDVLFLVPALPQ